MRAVAGASLVALAAAASVAAEKPTFTPTDVKGAFVEQFTDDWAGRWTPSKATKKTPVGSETFSYVGQWEVEESSVRPAIVGDKGLVAKSKASHHAISAPFAAPIDPKGKPFVVQYEAKFQKGGNCGGGYLKLLEEGFNSEEFSDKTPWVVMFGQDLTCPGSKVHFIFRHQNPITKEWEEKHLKSAPTPHVGENTNLYTLIVNPDNTFEILINNESNTKGNLLESFEPPVNPPKEIDDPEDKKPSDWVDEEKIADPAASKPEDWDEDAPREIPDEEATQPEGWLTDEPLTIPDPDAEKPEEWDDEEDGDWIAPTIPNPKCTEGPGCGPWVRPMKANPAYKGKWSAPLIDNPAYKGVWSPRKIENPNYFEDLHPANLNKIVS
ncbi:calnexin [Rhizoctonia solani AG-1 IA]|uniref:Calnexin n=1 Tax=Thanatephorus cucumeris (strain AG1-IA) TaxID=983506 RepID=L8WTZ2_THACA|nr:calnexin [Rhizoctonia solani AG-1 IA]